MRHGATLLVVVLLLSGCTGALDPGGWTAGSEWSGDEDNHFREETLTVALESPHGDDRDYRPMVRAALDYWATNAERYAGFPVRFELSPDAADPDVTVQFVPEITDCGSETHTAGCAPIVDRPSQVQRPVRVRVKTGYSPNSTVQVLKHELGHTLGLRHDDEPHSVMRSKSLLTTLPRRNATERAMPWASPELSVYVDDGNVSASEREETARQVAGALGYFADGADGTVPENVSFTRTDDRSAADVVVVFADSAACTTGGGSCGELQGLDPDGDGELETYTRLRVVVAGVDPEARGWHVGFWLARGFGLTDDELPEPLASDDPQVRRSDWWT